MLCYPASPIEIQLAPQSSHQWQHGEIHYTLYLSLSVCLCIHTHIYKECVNEYLQQNKDQLCEECETFYLLRMQVSWVRQHVCTC